MLKYDSSPELPTTPPQRGRRPLGIPSLDCRAGLVHVDPCGVFMATPNCELYMNKYQFTELGGRFPGSPPASRVRIDAELVYC